MTEKRGSSILHKRTLGQKSADLLTIWIGSWTFIIIFMIFLIIWIFANISFLNTYSSEKAFDPYPFILLNLVLGFLATIQAPIILMSQNREAQKNRLRAEYDYAVDRKAEKEIQEIKEHIKELKEHINKKFK